MTEFPLDESWEWVDAPWGRVLQCRPLAGLAAHLFTTRDSVLTGGAVTADAGWRLLAAALEVTPEAVVCLNQVHGRTVLVAVDEVRRRDPAGWWGTADAAIAASPHLALSVRVADCVPALLADRASGAVAAVHAGWRGTVAGIAGAAIEALGSTFGTNPSDVVAAIGPSIGPCCYRVGGEVADAFAAIERWQGFLGRWLTPSPSRRARLGIPGSDPAAAGGRALFFDTWTANADQFAAAGVPCSQIHVSGLCTSCHREVFPSYRVEGKKAGRMIGAIRSGPRR